MVFLCVSAAVPVQQHRSCRRGAVRTTGQLLSATTLHRASDAADTTATRRGPDGCRGYLATACWRTPAAGYHDPRSKPADDLLLTCWKPDLPIQLPTSGRLLVLNNGCSRRLNLTATTTKIDGVEAVKRSGDERRQLLTTADKLPTAANNSSQLSLWYPDSAI